MGPTGQGELGREETRGGDSRQRGQHEMAHQAAAGGGRFGVMSTRRLCLGTHVERGRTGAWEPGRPGQTDSVAYSVLLSPLVFAVSTSLITLRYAWFYSNLSPHYIFSSWRSGILAHSFCSHSTLATSTITSTEQESTEASWMS